MQNSLSEWDQDLSSDEDEIYRSFYRALQRTEGFGLFFVRCVEGERNKLIERLQQDLPKKKIERLALDRPVEDGNLYKIISQLPNRNEIDVLFIAGIEKSLEPYIQPGYGGQGDYYKRDTVPRVLGHLNLQRERFRDDFPFAIVFLVPLFALKYFMLRSPDFFDWRSGLFEFPQEKEDVDQASSRYLEMEYDDFSNLTHSERFNLLREFQSLIDEDHQSTENKVELWRKQGLIWSADDNPEAALASYDRALEIKPDSHEAWYGRGTALPKLERYEEAIASYDRALKIKPNSHEAWYGRGSALDALKRYEEAIASYDRALEIKPGSHEAWYNRGNILGSLERYEEAIVSYDRALEIKPDKHAAWNNRGTALDDLERYEEAIASYDRALEIKPDNHYAWYNRGYALGNLERYEEAIASYDRALEIKPDDHKAWDNRGYALGNLERYEEAIASYDRALEIKPDFANAIYNKACCYALQAHIETAIAHLQQAIALDPNYREMAKTDSDFDYIRDNQRFQELLNES
jgi:tetratricopeptide (TPR) repeat protein